jgi:hypothetical protein
VQLLGPNGQPITGAIPVNIFDASNNQLALTDDGAVTTDIGVGGGTVSELITAIEEAVAAVDSGTVSSGTTGSLTDSEANWETNEWQNAHVFFYHGNQKFSTKIASNTGSVLAFTSTISQAPVDGDTYEIKLPVEAVSVTSLPGSPAQDGTNGSGISIPVIGTGSGAVGIKGWLSLLYGLFTGQLSNVIANVQLLAITTLQGLAGFVGEYEDLPFILVDTTASPAVGVVLGANATDVYGPYDRYALNPMVKYIRVNSFADQAGTLNIQECETVGGVYSTTATYSIVALATGGIDWTRLTKQFFQFQVVNGPVAQTVFRLNHTRATAGRRDIQVVGRATTQSTLQNAAAATGQGTAATMAVPFSVDFTVKGANSPVFTITPQMYDNAGNGPFTCPVYQMDATPGLPVTTISATGHSYHVELPGGWSFYVNLTALTTGSGITVTIPATVEAN